MDPVSPRAALRRNVQTASPSKVRTLARFASRGQYGALQESKRGQAAGVVLCFKFRGPESRNPRRGAGGSLGWRLGVAAVWIRNAGGAAG